MKSIKGGTRTFTSSRTVCATVMARVPCYSSVLSTIIVVDNLFSMRLIWFCRCAIISSFIFVVYLQVIFVEIVK